jgi:hypothetical protein
LKFYNKKGNGGYVLKNNLKAKKSWTDFLNQLSRIRKGEFVVLISCFFFYLRDEIH